jgi:uncharacterized protein YjbI with pentapeptide repeats
MFTVRRFTKELSVAPASFLTGFIKNSSVAVHNSHRMEEDHHAEQEQHQSRRSLRDRVITTLGANPREWTVGDRRLAILAILIGLAIVITAVCGYVLGGKWSGLTEPKLRAFWDWLNLLIVPIVLALGGYLFTRSEARRAQGLANQRAQDEALQAYLDKMSELLINKNLHEKRDPYDDMRITARAQTLAVLRQLNEDRKGIVLLFLREARLINRNDSPPDRRKRYARIVGLRDADLKNANLRDAKLINADRDEPVSLEGAILKGADLQGADLQGADLREADLRGADLRRTNLSEADLSRANLSEACMQGAWLVGADLRHADLSKADLSGASMVYPRAALTRIALKGFEGVPMEQLPPGVLERRLTSLDSLGIEEVTNLELEYMAYSLKGATMPDGQKYEDWVKTKDENWLKDKEGCGEDGENGEAS